MVVAASSPSPGTPNMMLEICPLVPLTACMVRRNTAPGIICIPNTNGISSAIDSRPPIPGVTPTISPSSTASSISPMVWGEVSIAHSELNMISSMALTFPVPSAGGRLRHSCAPWEAGAAGSAEHCRTTPNRRASPRSENCVELRAPLLLLFGREHGGNHFLRIQDLRHARRVGGHIGARRQASLLGQLRLGIAAEHEVRRQQRRLRMRRLAADADRAEDQRDRIECPEIRGRGGEFGIDDEVRVVVELYGVFAGRDRTGKRKVAVGQYRLERGGEILCQLAALLLAVMGVERAQPFGVAFVDSDLPGPFWMLEEIVVGFRQVFFLD